MRRDDDHELDGLVWDFKHPRLAALRDWLRAWFAPKLVCLACRHFFDPSDRRAYIPRGLDQRYPARCPACALMTLSGREAWAVANDCQGIFEDAVRSTRKEASALLDEYPCANVRPVRIYDDISPEMREWEDYEAETARERLERAEASLDRCDQYPDCVCGHEVRDWTAGAICVHADRLA